MDRQVFREGVLSQLFTVSFSETLRPLFVDHIEGKRRVLELFGIVLIRGRRLHSGKRLELVSLQALVQ